jgi:signal transduction histidine kinase
VFGIELSNTQAKSKQDVEARVHERGVLAGALISSLFQTVEQQVPQDQRTYGAATVSAATMNHARQKGDLYVVLLDSSGNVIAHSSGFNAQARANLASSSALKLVHSGHPYGLGEVLPYGNTGAVDLAIAFPTQYGPRTLVTGFSPLTLTTFLISDLREIPGVRGAHNYVLDGNVVLASTNPSIPAGHVFTAAAQLRALKRSSGDVAGHYYDQTPLANSTWGIVLTAPDGPLFASVSGLRKWVPWMIFAALAVFAIATLVLVRRTQRSAGVIREANERLELLNSELEATNGALERRALELARSNSELEQFAAIASHDLQEPLRKVRTFTERLTLIEAEHLSDKGRDYLQRANAAAERMQKLIEDLLKYSRVATHGRRFASVDLQQVVRDVLEDLDAQVAAEGAQIHAGELPTINGDSLQLRQLFQNLISNGIKFRRPDVTPEVWVDATESGDLVSLTVRDNGIGFEPQYGDRIFRVFERLHGRGEYPGTGIGLALCRRIAERHGGNVTAESEPGAGSTFTVSLPMHQRDEVVVAYQHDYASTTESKQREEEAAHVAV